MKRGRLVVLTGPSGTGKSTLLRYLEEEFGAECAKKFTTRPSRNTVDDERDFVFCKADDFPDEKRILRFDSYQHSFGIQLDKIDESLQRGANHAIIVGDYNAVRRLFDIYKESMRTVFVFCNSVELFGRIEKDGGSHRASRLSAIREEIASIYDNLSCIDFVIDNSGPLRQSLVRLSWIVRAIEFD